MEDLKDHIDRYANQDLNQRKNWYSPAAEAYDRVRPRYDPKILDRAIEIAHLPPQSRILEIGCGPGIATVPLARSGFEILALEPNKDFYRLAQKNSIDYPNVEIRNVAFEEWELEEKSFDAILAATSIHWIPAEIAYPNAAKALRDDRCLILLWNTRLEPNYEVYRALEEVYQTHAPSLASYEGKKIQEEHLAGFGKIVLDSGYFKNLISEQIPCEVTYSVGDYLTLLSTYSPYLELDAATRGSLFQGLKDKIESTFGSTLELSYLCAFQVARK